VRPRTSICNPPQQSNANTTAALIVHRAPGAPRSEIKEEGAQPPGDIRGGEHPVSCARAPKEVPTGPA